MSGLSLAGIDSQRYAGDETDNRSRNQKSSTRGMREKRGWQRPTLPLRCQSSTIGAGGLNVRVRDGSGWTPAARATNTHASLTRSPRLPVFTSPKKTRSSHAHALSRECQLPRTTHTGSPRPLVPVGCTRCRASTSGLSNWWSTSGLARFRDGETHLQVGFPLRCFQRFSTPESATRRCHWRDNRLTGAPSTPVLSY